MCHSRLAGCIGLTLIASFSCPSEASPVEHFYRGKTVNFYVGTGPGGGYDATTRLMAMHFGRHIPGNPSFVVRNMPGAGGIPLANFIYNLAAKDGTVIGMPQNGVAFEPLFKIISKDGGNIQFDPLKYNWIGNPVVETMVMFSSASSPFKTYKDLLSRPMISGTTGVQTDNALMPLILTRTLGAQFKLVSGYQGPADMYLALERGEIEGIGAAGYSGLVATKGDWLSGKKINLLMQFGLKSDARIGHVPMAVDLAKNAEDRLAMELVFSKYRLTRAVFAPPDVPAERIAALREAFGKMLSDSAFLDDASRQGTEIELVTAQDIHDVIRKAYAAPRAVVERASMLMSVETKPDAKK